ncbi:MAG: hypothetical protein ABR595_03750 [Psychroflexus sp.]
MIKKVTKHACFIILMISISSCSKMITGIYGMKTPEEMDSNSILEYAEKYDIPTEEVYEVKKAYYVDLFTKYNTEKYEEEFKNRSQVLQVSYYNTEDGLESFHSFCNTSGFPNKRWNKTGNFDEFIPGQQAKLDQLFPLNDLLEYFKPLENTEKLNPSAYDYVVVVFWSKFMGRQSKRLIKTVQKNIKLAKNDDVKVIYVNNDNVASGIEL